MKAVIVCSLVLLALVHGDNGIHWKSHRKINARFSNSVQHLLSGKEGQLCTPGTEFEDFCSTCYCSEKGNQITCGANRLCPESPRYRRDIPSNSNTNDTFIDRSCVMCTCEIVGPDDLQICSTGYYEVCPRNIPRRTFERSSAIL